MVDELCRNWRWPFAFLLWVTPSWRAISRTSVTESWYFIRSTVYPAVTVMYQSQKCTQPWQNVQKVRTFLFSSLQGQIIVIFKEVSFARYFYVWNKERNTKVILGKWVLKHFCMMYLICDTLRASGPCANCSLSVSIDISGVTHFPGTFKLRLTKWWVSCNDWPLPQSFPDWFRYSHRGVWEGQGHWRGRLGTEVRLNKVDSGSRSISKPSFWLHLR